MVTFTSDGRSCDVSFKGNDQVGLQARLSQLSRNRYLADSVVNTYERLVDAGFEVEVTFAKEHSDSGHAFRHRQPPPSGSSSISFKVNGINFAVARIRIDSKFDTNDIQTQNAWWSIEIAENTAGNKRVKLLGRCHHQFLVKGENHPIALEEFYQLLFPIIHPHHTLNSPKNGNETKLSFGDSMNLNIIKYGPPGTGKTYSLVNDIKSLFQLNQQQEENAGEIKSIADLKNKLGNQIEFLTFHQSYSYEDFIEGIKAEITEAQQVNYAVKNGVFKKISRRAYLHKLIKQQNQPAITDITAQLLDLYAENTDQELAIKAKNEPNGLAQIIKNLITEADKKAPATDQTPKYVLCIDEINRGNLSRIFGELITCIEKSKRQGSDETIPVTLPYSGDQFVVPDNLYIIGTMNTADRSLVKLDNAMRRRFTFELIKPDPMLLNENVGDVPLRNFFININGKIKNKLGPDFELGHAYFMNIDNEEAFGVVIKNNIIPLLNEYFFNNRDSILEILRGTVAERYLNE